jgi:hypothetical protein
MTHTTTWTADSMAESQGDRAILRDTDRPFMKYAVDLIDSLLVQDASGTRGQVLASLLYRAGQCAACGIGVLPKQFSPNWGHVISVWTVGAPTAAQFRIHEACS